MDFLKNLVIPLSPEHIQLLHYILMLIYFLFIPFISLIIGGTAISLYYRRKGVSESNNIYLRFAKDVIELVTVNKSTGIALGILTLITSVMVYIQLLHATNVETVSYLGISVLLIIVGMILVYTYRYSLSFTELFDSIKEYESTEQSVNNELKHVRENSRKLSSSTGSYGLFFLFIGLWAFSAATVLAVKYSDLSSLNLLGLFFSWSVVSKFIVILSGALAFTGGYILFRFFYWEGGLDLSDEAYKKFAKNAGLKSASIGAIIVPLFLLADLLNLPDSALSSAVFFYAVLALILIFLGYQFLYVMISKKITKYAPQVFFLILFTLFSITIKDQLALDNSTKLETVKLAANYEQVLQKLTGETKAPKISGKEIFQNICSACHAFDHKVVGPPYIQTLPKYKGNVDKLVKFILSPTQNNPGYPPMPNPGLKPNQAKAVATYILSEVKNYQK